jgi:hypothetical protein
VPRNWQPNGHPVIKDTGDQMVIGTGDDENAVIMD